MNTVPIQPHLFHVVSEKYRKKRKFEQNDPNEIIKDLSQVVENDIHDYVKISDITFLAMCELVNSSALTNLYKKEFNSCEEYKAYLEQVEILSSYIERIYKPFIEKNLKIIFGEEWKDIFIKLLKCMEECEHESGCWNQELKNILEANEKANESFFKASRSSVNYPNLFKED